MYKMNISIALCICLVGWNVYPALTISEQAKRSRQKLNTEFELSCKLNQAIEQDDAQEISRVLTIFPDLKNNDFLGRVKPLAYAVILRNNNAVDSLIAAGADTSVQEPNSGNSLLHIAAHFSNQAAVSKLIEEGLSVRSKNKRDQIPLHIALQAENVKNNPDEDVNLIHDLLMQDPASINARDELGATVLHYAVIQNNHDLVCQCIIKNADVSIRDQAGLIALDYAILNKNSAIFETLWDAIDQEKNPYQYYDKTALIKLLRGPQYDLNSAYLCLLKSECSQDELNKILLKASWFNHVQITKLALAAGADVNTVDNFAQTPLHKACYKGQVKIVQVLIDAGADLNALKAYNWTPLHVASCQGDIAIVQALIAAGADLSIKDSHGRIALDMVKTYCPGSEIRHLLQDAQEGR